MLHGGAREPAVGGVASERHVLDAPLGAGTHAEHLADVGKMVGDRVAVLASPWRLPTHCQLDRRAAGHTLDPGVGSDSPRARECVHQVLERSEAPGGSRSAARSISSTGQAPRQSPPRTGNVSRISTRVDVTCRRGSACRSSAARRTTSAGRPRRRAGRGSASRCSGCRSTTGRRRRCRRRRCAQCSAIAAVPALAARQPRMLERRDPGAMVGRSMTCTGSVPAAAR